MNIDFIEKEWQNSAVFITMSLAELNAIASANDRENFYESKACGMLESGKSVAEIIKRL